MHYIYAVCIHELQEKLVSIRKFNSLTAVLAYREERKKGCAKVAPNIALIS